MRYYSIEIDGAPKQFGLGGTAGKATWTSFVNGQNVPAAWNVVLDIPVGPAAMPMGGALIEIYGISLAEIGQAADLINKKIRVFGGMQAGLPLANPRQAGLLCQGYVFQAFGNWIGTEQTLSLIVQPGDPPGSPTGGGKVGAGAAGGGLGAYDAPVNLVLNWTKGQKLGDAVQQALKVAFPSFKITVATSDRLVWPADQWHVAPSLTQLGQWVKQISRAIIKDAGYTGVEIVATGDTISVYDGTVAGGASAIQIAFTDLIGQPTWIQAPTMQIKTVMRSDIRVGGRIKLPQTSVINTAQALSALLPNQRLSFQGEFFVQAQRHVGNFRQVDGNSWVTIINAAPLVLGGA